MTVAVDTVLEGEIVDLDFLAKQINVAHREAVQYHGASLQAAVRAGLGLIEAKRQVKHGEWLPWLAENFEGSEDSAQGYMKVARNTERVRYLDPETSLRSALKALSGSEASSGGGGEQAQGSSNPGEQFDELKHAVDKAIDEMYSHAVYHELHSDLAVALQEVAARVQNYQGEDDD